jgi:hypothetical protein
MWRVAKRVLLAGAILLGVTVALLLVADAITSAKVRDRTAFWRSRLDAAVRVGESRDEAEQLLAKAIPDRDVNARIYDPAQRKLVILPEVIKAVGVAFPCSEWVILVDIKLDLRDRVISKTVTAAGVCI